MMFFKTGVKAAGVAGVILGAVLSLPAGAETLREALAMAYQGNPDLLAARAEQRAVDETLPTAASNWRPSVSGQVELSQSDTTSQTIRSTDDAVVSDVAFQGRNETYAVEITQPIFRGFRNFNEYNSARAEIKAGRASLLNTEQQVLLDTVIAYMDVRRDLAILELNRNNVTVLRRQLEATRNRFEVGEITRTDVAQSEAALAGAISDRVSAEAALTASRAAYKRLVGRAPGTLEEAPPLPPLPDSEKEAVDIALARNPLIVQTEFLAMAADYDIDVAKGALLPTLEAFAGYQRNQSPSFTFDPETFGFSGARRTSESTQFGLRLSVPLYQSGAQFSQIRRSKQVHSQRRMQVFAAERQVREDVRRTWENYQAARERIEAIESQVEANKIALEGVRQEALVGARTTLDVLEAEQVLLQSRVNLSTARRDLYVAGFEVLQTVGRLNAVSLDLPVERYDPATYYDRVKWKFVGWGNGTED